MGGTIFALLLFGCSDDGQACERLADAQPQHYNSQALCELDADSALESPAARRADYPEVAAKCVPVGALALLGHGAYAAPSPRVNVAYSFDR